MSTSEKASREVTVINATGLHARPASQFVQKAAHHKADIHVIKDNRHINAKSIMGILSGGISQGTTITIEAEGPDATEAVNELAELIESGFDDE
ncbi:MAG: HPr family phosphocarrier protein [Eubacteriaceae bacterium]|jgi:phosphocarrier protein HPr